MSILSFVSPLNLVSMLMLSREYAHFSELAQFSALSIIFQFISLVIRNVDSKENVIY